MWKVEIEGSGQRIFSLFLLKFRGFFLKKLDQCSPKCLKYGILYFSALKTGFGRKNPIKIEIRVHPKNDPTTNRI